MKTFEKNKYCKLYFKIISNRKFSPISSEDYCERHHIFPSSLGGPNSKRNLVKLSSREHFLCHYLLTKMCKNETHIKKMIYALNMMGWNSSGKRYVNSKLYEKNKLRFSQQMKTDEERNNKISRTLKKQRVGEGNPMFGRDFSKLHRENISKALKGKERPKEVRDKISESRMGLSVETSLKTKLNLSKAFEKRNGPKKIKIKIRNRKSRKLERYEKESDFVRTILFNNKCPKSKELFNPPLKVLRRAFGEENLENVVNRLSQD